MKKNFLLLTSVFITAFLCCCGNVCSTDNKGSIGSFINISKAALMLSEKLPDYDNRHLSYEKSVIHNVSNEERCYYIFRSYDDFPDHRATTGWYSVDVETGECFNTNVLTEWTEME